MGHGFGISIFFPVVYQFIIILYHITIWFPYFPHKEMLIKIGAWTRPTRRQEMIWAADWIRRGEGRKYATDVEDFVEASNRKHQWLAELTSTDQKKTSILSLINQWKKKSVSASEIKVQPATSLSPLVFVSFNDNHQKIEIQQDPRIDNQHWKMGSWPSGI